jgi:hypothetical protein
MASFVRCKAYQRFRPPIKTHHATMIHPLRSQMQQDPPLPFPLPQLSLDHSCWPNPKDNSPSFSLSGRLIMLLFWGSLVAWILPKCFQFGYASMSFVMRLRCILNWFLKCVAWTERKSNLMILCSNIFLQKHWDHVIKHIWSSVFKIISICLWKDVIFNFIAPFKPKQFMQGREL